MKSLEKIADGTTRRRSSLPRRMLDFACQTMANHTAAGPGSLAPAQATVARRGAVQSQPGSCEDREPAQRSHATYTKFSTPLRQVFWI